MQQILTYIFIALYSVTILGVVLVIITENRNPLKTLPWIIVLVFAPVVGLVFYFFFGQNLSKQRIISRRKMCIRDSVTGTVELILRPRNYTLVGVESPFDLMKTDFGEYGEVNKAWTADDAKGFTKILANPIKIYYNVQKRNEKPEK